MTSKNGDGVHPGDPWHPDWKPHTAPPVEDQWPLDMEAEEETDEELEDDFVSASPVLQSGVAEGALAEAGEDELLEPDFDDGAAWPAVEATPFAGRPAEEEVTGDTWQATSAWTDVPEEQATPTPWPDDSVATLPAEEESAEVLGEVVEEGGIIGADELPGTSLVDLEAADAWPVDAVTIEPTVEPGVATSPAGPGEEIPYLRTSAEEWWESEIVAQEAAREAAAQEEAAREAAAQEAAAEEAAAREAAAEGESAPEGVVEEAKTSTPWIDEEQLEEAWAAELPEVGAGPLIDPATAETPSHGWDLDPAPAGGGASWTGALADLDETVDLADASLLGDDEPFEVVDALPGDLEDGTAEHVLDVADFEERGGEAAGLLFQTPAWVDGTETAEDEDWDEDEDEDEPDEALEAAPGYDEPPAAWEQESAEGPTMPPEVPEQPEVSSPSLPDWEAEWEREVSGQLDLDEDGDQALETGASGTEAGDAGSTAEEMIVAGLTEDMEDLEFESFALHEFTGTEYQHAQTQEHAGLAKAMAENQPDEGERRAMAAAIPGLDSGLVDFDDVVDQTAGILDDGPLPEKAVRGGLRAAARSDLALRVVSAVAFGVAFLLTLWPGGWWVTAFLGLVALVGLTEFYSAARKQGYRPVSLFGLGGAAGALIGAKVAGPIAVPAALGAVTAATFAWYAAHERLPSEPWKNGVVTVFGVAWVAGLLSFAVAMADSDNRFRLLFATLLVAAFMDIGSYFIGRSFGRRKLAPMISPNKTVEGLLGGALVALVVAMIVGVLLDPFTIGKALVLALVVIVVAPFGDLAESMVKRDLGIKDMGAIVAGHGGVLDRIDAYLFVLPAAYLAFRWMALL